MDIDSPPSPGFPDPLTTAPPSSLDLPAFSAGFPLPFRVLFLLGLAILLWATNLHILNVLGLDTSWILDFRDDPNESAKDSLELETIPDVNSHSHVELLPDTPIRDASPISRAQRPESGKLFGPVYKLFLLYTAWVGGGWLAFRWVTGAEPEAMERWRWLVGVIAVGAGVGAVAPWRGIGQRERAGLRRSIKRIFMPPLNSPVFFSDVILADILTSFAKVLGDLWVSACQIWNGGITEGRVAQTGWSNWITLFMVCLPYLLRFRQCLLEYYQSSWTSPRPLANALKYFSAFPVIFLSAMQKSVASEIASAKGITVQQLGDTHDRWFGEHPIFRLWLLAVVINSMYSFYWDIELDWGLSLCEVDTWLGPNRARGENGIGLIGPGGTRQRGRSGDGNGWFWGKTTRLWTRASSIAHQRSPCPTPSPQFDHLDHVESPADVSIARNASPGGSLFAFGLRPTLLLPDPIVYHLFALVDLVLRFTWSLKLSSHLHTISEIESGVFIMEALELVRRWMWVFVRMEWEAVKMGEAARLGRARGQVVWDEGDKEEGK